MTVKQDPRGVIIKNNAKRGYYFPACEAKHGLACYPKGRGLFMVGPGTAELPLEYMEWAANKNPTVSAWFECGDLEVVEVTAEFGGDKWEPLKPEDLTKMKDEAAEWFVKHEDDVDALRRWHKAERRKSIKDAIAKKLPAAKAEEE